MDIEGATGRRPFKKNAYDTANEIRLAISTGCSGRVGRVPKTLSGTRSV